MSNEREPSNDRQIGAETFEQSDEAFDEATRLDGGFLEAVERDPAMDPSNQVDLTELEEIGSQLDDPEAMVTLSDGSDDPDGYGGPPPSKVATLADRGGWDLAAPLTETSFDGDLLEGADES